MTSQANRPSQGQICTNACEKCDQTWEAYQAAGFPPDQQPGFRLAYQAKVKAWFAFAGLKPKSGTDLAVTVEHLVS